VQGISAIFRKEMGDHFSSMRFVLIAALIVMVGVIVASMVGMSVRQDMAGANKPSLVFLFLFTSTGKFFSFFQFMGFFGPLIGIILGFDAVNRERISRTLSKLVSQPIYRDSIINAKFLAGVTTIGVVLGAIMLIISGLGMRLIGVVPGVEEVLRLFAYFVVTLFYISFWLGIAILFSVMFRSTATSALASLAVWIFFAFFVSLGAGFVANAVAPIPPEPTREEKMFGLGSSARPEIIVRNAEIERRIALFSPVSLYGDAASLILDPVRKSAASVVLVGPLERLSLSRFQNPLPFGQSLLIAAPYLVLLIAITLLCFGTSYAVFMRQEIRSA
jgi:ABC-2 type transport system permease protein